MLTLIMGLSRRVRSECLSPGFWLSDALRDCWVRTERGRYEAACSMHNTG